jgi:hypothetical protein
MGKKNMMRVNRDKRREYDNEKTQKESMKREPEL